MGGVKHFGIYKKNNEALQQQGWRLLLVWECAFKGALRLPFEQLIEAIEGWIRSEEGFGEIGGCAEEG
jgi:DNA mismatch endonuclease, patch repair protein